MRLQCHQYIVARNAFFIIFSLLHSLIATVGATASATSSASALNQSQAPTCEFRTINYITDTLPQLCLRTAWLGSDPPLASKTPGTLQHGADGAKVESTLNSSAGTPTGNHESIRQKISNNAATRQVQISSEKPEPTTETPSSSSTPTATASTGSELEDGELNHASFLSFEDWKKQTLEKAGQQNSNIGNKKSSGRGGQGRKPSENIPNHLESLGDEGEINIDFGAFSSDGTKDSTSQKLLKEDSHNSQKLQQEDSDTTTRRKDQYRSKDAGKTCKERFSYASFDAGATVLKTHPGAKNAKAVLVENKDSYMLSECSTENKFLIIELSEDIWIDTLVLANYEFFSSMLRTFRVSVSDKYPVKIDKWKDLGVHEARNSREIQAFLIENPQIWARYIRIEFLSHYGKEYYCPLSLVRVHGRRMLESWKETEANNDDDADDNDEDVDEQFVPEAVAEEVKQPQKEQEAVVVAADEPTSTPETSAYSSGSKRDWTPSETRLWQSTSPSQIFMFGNSDKSESQREDICLLSEAPGYHLTSHTSIENVPTTSVPSVQMPTTPEMLSTPFSDNGITSSTPSTRASAQQTLSEEALTPGQSSTTEAPNDTMKSSKGDNSDTTAPSSITSAVYRAQNATGTNRNKTTSTSASAALPTIQESFFKAVSRRLQLLESNSTLSLKYIEEQSKMLREAFTKVEKKQLQKTSDFLEGLNSTVLAELRGFRQQYDEIWQSTVISLESQRDESRREILAISTRLNILADEVVFQKRMSIIQSVLLLLCLGLVIFSRVSAAGSLDFSNFQSSRSRFFPGLPVESPIDTPRYRREDSRDDYISDSQQWNGHHRRQGSDDSLGSRSLSRGWGPPTPVSAYSRSENELTPPRTHYHEGPEPDMLGTPTVHRVRKSSPLANGGNDEKEGRGFVGERFEVPPEKEVMDVRERNESGNGHGLASPPPAVVDYHDTMHTHATAQDEQFIERPPDDTRIDDDTPHVTFLPPQESGENSIVQKPLPALPPRTQ